MRVSGEVLDNFFGRIEKFNVAKEEEAPVAVVIKASHDANGMFSAAPVQSLLLQIAKTHKVAIKTIDDAKQFGEAIREVYSREGKKPSLLFILAHGYPDRLQFGRQSLWGKFWKEPFYQKNHIFPEDFQLLSPKAEIVLYSCNAGLGIAQAISNISGKPVHAPMGALWDTKTCLQNWPTQGVRVVSYNEKNQQHMCCFMPGKLPSLLSTGELSSEENRASLCEMANFLRESASRGDANAQWKIGMFSLLGMGTCSKSEKDAAYWLELASNQNVPQAQFELGMLYLSGEGGLEQSDLEAGKWFSRSADKEFPPALFQMGIFCLNGQCGFSQSDEKAVRFFTLAAKKGAPQALFNLGVLYENGRGVHRSITYAKHLYKISEGLGIPGAKDRLDSLHKLDSDKREVFLWRLKNCILTFVGRLYSTIFVRASVL